MNKPREQHALDAYIKFLQNKGATVTNLQKRNQFLQKLIPKLDRIECNGDAYRLAVETFERDIERKEWLFFLSVVREYYSFWVEDIKTIVGMSSDPTFDLEPVVMELLQGPLKALWQKLDQEKFTTVESWSIKAYTHGLKQHGASQSLIDTRVKLVKLVVVQIRTAPEPTNKQYRLSVDSIMFFFQSRETRELFLSVVREFYHFWIGDPDAADHLLVGYASDAA
ncbi:MAG TPA: hypothetical protein VK974_11215 [Methylophilaceae bacterium]|nr:hypothetical protein [Methylophilaceae bacterium]